MRPGPSADDRYAESMVTLARIPAGSVTLRDARRGTERTVKLVSYEFATTTVTATEFMAGRRLTEQEGRLPATGVRWMDAVTWCNSASEAERLQPAYLELASGVRWDPTANGFRLPTEAEWVHASMGGTPGPRHGPLDEIAWSASDRVTGPRPAALKAANAFGVFDTLGNVWEWCWDRLDPARYGDYRLLKGGGWADPAWSCRVGVRRGNAPDAVVEDVGLRIARGAVAPGGDGDASGLGTGGGQGWSEAADRRRASLPHPLPLGWTPLHVE